MCEGASKQSPDLTNYTATGPRPPVLKFLDPALTCARYFDFRLQMFLNKVLRHEIEPIGKIMDFFSASSFSKEVLLMFTFYFGLIELQNLVLIQKTRLCHS